MYILYKLFFNTFIVMLRIITSVILILLLVYYFNSPYFYKILAVSLLFIVNEWFLNLKVYYAFPLLPVVAIKDNINDSLMYELRFEWERQQDIFKIIKKSLNFSDVKIILTKISPDAMEFKEKLSREELLHEAKNLVIASHGNYITYLDIVVAYITLTESKTRFLESRNLTKEDLETLYYWVRNLSGIDVKTRKTIDFKGRGIFEFFIYGWNVDLKKYTVDVTNEVLSRKQKDIFIGRIEEYKQLLVSLAKETSHGVIIVGEVGTGKTSLIEHFIRQSFENRVPGNMSHKKVYELRTDILIAGVGNAGDLEERLKNILLDIEHGGDVILLVQNIENIFGGGGFKFDLSGVLFDFLKKGKISIIGTATPPSYKIFLESKSTVRDLFDVIHYGEPDMQNSLFMILAKARDLEKQHAISISYQALKECLNLSSSYLPDAFLPGRAIRLLTDVITEEGFNGVRRIDKKEIIKKVEKKTRIVLEEPSLLEKDLLLNLENILHKRVIGQDEAITAVASSLRRLRTGFKQKQRPISSFLFLGPTGVGKTETAKALALSYFGNEKLMIRLDMSEYQTQDSIVRLLGQQESGYSVNTLVDKVKEMPFSLILLDEFEKAHPQILNLFLQVFDEGRLTDNKGYTVSFINTIIIATSNAGSELIRERTESKQETGVLSSEVMNYLLTQGIYKPELLNRFDEIVIFKPLSRENARKVSNILLNSSLKKLEEKQLFISFDASVEEKVVKEGYDNQFGARNIQHYIQKTIEEYISRLILNGSLTKGARAVLSVDEAGQYSVK